MDQDDLWASVYQNALGRGLPDNEAAMHADMVTGGIDPGWSDGDDIPVNLYGEVSQ
jgi:hypothetical protein